MATIKDIALKAGVSIATVSKLIKYPYESPVGIVTSFLGAVFYIFIASREIKRGGAVEK